MQYHAHVYFDPQQLSQAAQLHQELSHLPVRLGRIHTLPIGPHPKPMFQVLFEAVDYAFVRAWLEAHRMDLDVLLHKETGDHLADHTTHTEWLGDAHNLRLEVFGAQWPEGG